MELHSEQVSALLSTSRVGRSLELKPSTGSTNDDARRAAQQGAPDGHVIVADEQTNGRGSRGRSWVSPPGTDLYFSLIARLPLAPSSVPPLTLAVGLAMAEGIEGLLPVGERALVKWPNDVWVARKKLIGILVESASAGEQLEPVVIGVGVNVNRRVFPDDLATPATSLALLRGADIDRSVVLAALLSRLEPWLDRFVLEGPEPIVRALNERLALRGERVTCDDQTGVLEGVAATGALLLRTSSGARECIAGTLRPCEAGAEAPA
jgi:BirA family transcriptional regulator, biotin operon repressor / biotin---[acetyl-CoA-carboxylase] ligase